MTRLIIHTLESNREKTISYLHEQLLKGNSLSVDSYEKGTVYRVVNSVNYLSPVVTQSYCHHKVL